MKETTDEIRQRMTTWFIQEMNANPEIATLINHLHTCFSNDIASFIFFEHVCMCPHDPDSMTKFDEKLKEMQKDNPDAGEYIDDVILVQHQLYAMMRIASRNAKKILKEIN